MGSTWTAFRRRSNEERACEPGNLLEDPGQGCTPEALNCSILLSKKKPPDKKLVLARSWISGSLGWILTL